MRRSKRTVASAWAAAAVLALVTACTNPGGPGGTPTTAPPAPTTAPPAGGSTLRGPAPTEASVTAARGPFPIAQSTVTRGNGFGGGTIYYPTDTSQGTFGAIVVVPGFVSTQSSISWYGPRIASQGFVVMTIDTNTTTDFPASRAQQQNAALTWLSTQSPVAGRIDRQRLGAMGWSMGGGGTLEAARTNPAIKAAIPLAPWNTTTDWSSVRTPTLVVACQNDAVAPVASHSQKFYNTLAGEKGLLEMAGGDHFCVTNANTTIARYSISWLKRFIDGDTRYSPFICTAALPTGASRYLNTCPV
jgi:dienelactone hydrolase